ncbi:hypothetical protein CCMSSC00406_0008524 [Pleurotus cornucopiae]|uniref:Uncharacterized protein n=1 Tax=Pleurotus cornucopiae TaxID=5321 RepID=A0ACB7J371_PLECO|nr:hypothetical protein CCMSSC00406_0008524 [Pleurotus cornucopiae]
MVRLELNSTRGLQGQSRLAGRRMELGSVEQVEPAPNRSRKRINVEQVAITSNPATYDLKGYYNGSWVSGNSTETTLGALRITGHTPYLSGAPNQSYEYNVNALPWDEHLTREAMSQVADSPTPEAPHNTLASD